MNLNFSVNRLFSRTDQSIFGLWWWTIDRTLLAAFIILMICGVVLVATASPPVAARIGVLIFGMEVKGAQRWLSLPGFSLQPSEVVKPTLAIVAAWMMAKQKENPTFPGNKIAAGMFVTVILLLLLQPDFGMTVVVACIFGAQMLLAGLPWRFVGVLGGLAAACSAGAYITLDHVKSRIDRFLDPGVGDNYQVDQALTALREGGLFGTGPGQGTVKLHIPDAHADFIFAVAGEEMGLLFVGFIILLFAFIVLRGFNRIMDSDDMFAVLASGGLLVMFGLQALVHMGANVHMLPAKGMTLPFISYGGSSLLAVSFSAGVILALTRGKSRQGIARGSRIAKGGIATERA